jgi:hypothetical protein
MDSNERSSLPCRAVLSLMAATPLFGAGLARADAMPDAFPERPRAKLLIAPASKERNISLQ